MRAGTRRGDRRSARSIRDETDGYFTDWPGGRFDPSGLVKGWAIERAAAMLSAAGLTSHSVNGAGDLQCTGEPEPGQPWRIGMAHPLRPAALAAVVTGRDIAVATSGTAERGAHIVNPHTGQPAADLASVTVTGPRAATADAYATAAFAMGPAARDWVESLDGYEALGIRPGRRDLADQRLRRLHRTALTAAGRRSASLSPRHVVGSSPLRKRQCRR